MALVLALPTAVSGEGASDARKRGDDRPKVAGPIALDFAAGARDGRNAVGFWPSTHWLQQVPGDPRGIEAHLMPRDDLDRELVKAAGTWHWDLEPGGYVYFLEGPGKLSPAPGLFYTSGTAKQGFAVTGALAWAGTVKVAPPATVPEHSQVRMQGLDAYLAGENVGFLFWRRANLRDARRGLQMPAGRVHVGLWDKTVGGYVAHSQPVVADPGRIAVAQLEPPAPGTADLVVLLRRPQPVTRASDDDVVLAVHTRDGKAVAPRVYGRANERVIAVWYGLPPGTAELRVSSAKVQLPATYLDLRRDRIERHEGRLQEAPKLQISLEVPPSMNGVERVVSVAQAPTMETLARETLPGSEREVVLQVPPTILDVTAQVGSWKLAQRVDLRDGADAEVVLRADGVMVSGRVLRGEHLERNATLTFGSDEDTQIVASALADGSYSVLLPRAGWWPVGVRLSGRTTSAVVLIEVDERNPEADVVLPDNEWIVAVVDATTGEPVVGATVAVGNVAEADGFRTWMRGDTDEAGEAFLHPLRPGKAELSARAVGYREQPAREEEVPQGSDHQRFVVELEPEREAVTLSVVLADGSPAAGAAAACVRPDGSLTLEQVADPEGKLAIEPSNPTSECVLLVRHAHAAPWAGVWRGDPVTIPLRASGGALKLLAAAGNDEPVPWAGLFVWIEGHRLSSQALGFFANQRASAERDGLWTLGSSPSGDLRILAVSPALWQLAQTGALDSQAQVVHPAGPGLVVVEAVR